MYTESMEAANSGWMVGSNAYAIIFGAWGVIATVFVVLARYLGRALDSQSDAFLLQLSVPIMVLVGGGLGLIFVPFPAFLVASPAGALMANSLVFGFWTLAQRRTGARHDSLR